VAVFIHAWPRYPAFLNQPVQKIPKVTGRGAAIGVAITSFWTLLSRVLGFVRDMLMTTVFGIFDDFVVAWMVPNLFRRLFGEGAVNAAIQPALARALEDEGDAPARSLYARFHNRLLLFLVVVVAVGEGILLFWQSAIGVDHADAHALYLASLLLPYVLPICLTALAGAPQQLSGKFAPSAFAPLLLNLTWIGALVFIQQSTPNPAEQILWLPPAILLGGFLQWAWQQPGVRKCGWPLLPRAVQGDERVSAAIRAFGPAVLGLAAVQINLLVDQILVRELAPEGANTSVFLASRLMQLPMALVGIAAATGVMPWFARMAAAREWEKLSAGFLRSVESTLLVILAAGFGLWILAIPTASVLFEHGAFGHQQSVEVGHTLQAYLWGLPAAAMIGLLARVRQSRGELKGTAMAAVAVIPLNLVLDVILLPRMGPVGAGYATAAALTLQVILLCRGLPDLRIRPKVSFSKWVRLPLPGIAAGGAAFALGQSQGPDFQDSVFGLLASIATGIVAAVLMAWLILPEDFRQLARRGNSPADE